MAGLLRAAAVAAAGPLRRMDQAVQAEFFHPFADFQMDIALPGNHYSCLGDMHFEIIFSTIIVVLLIE